MSRKGTMKENFVKRTTKKNKGQNTKNKYGKFTQKHVRQIENYKMKIKNDKD